MKVPNSPVTGIVCAACGVCAALTSDYLVVSTALAAIAVGAFVLYVADIFGE